MSSDSGVGGADRRRSTGPRSELQARPLTTRGVALGALAVGIPAVAALGYALWLGQAVSSNLETAPLLPQAETADPQGRELHLLAVGTIGDETVPGQRTDGRLAMPLVATISADRRSVELMALPPESRDAGGRTLTAAYAREGVPGVAEVGAEVLGVTFDHAIEIDEKGLAAVVDSLGGITVTTKDGNTQHLDGLATLDVLQRSAAPDGTRTPYTDPQLTVIQAVAAEAVSRETLANPLAVKRLMTAATEHTTIDESLTEQRMRELALELRGLRPGGITYVNAPPRRAAD